MRYNLCASGYNVDRAEQTSLIQFSGSVQERYKHSDERFFVFFFQAEDGIRDGTVTGVQTCALPIFAAREAAIGNGGIMPGRELAFVFSALRANDLVWSYVVNNYLKGRPPEAFDLLYWNADSTNLPGPMYCQYVRRTYLENALREPGRVTMLGSPIDLGAAETPAYLLATREDHIVPWRTAYRSTGLLGGELRL